MRRLPRRKRREERLRRKARGFLALARRRTPKASEEEIYQYARQLIVEHLGKRRVKKVKNARKRNDKTSKTFGVYKRSSSVRALQGGRVSPR